MNDPYASVTAEIRTKIIKFVRNNPGCTFAAVCADRRLDANTQSAGHHLVQDMVRRGELEKRSDGLHVPD